jgi:class 3 adenylate cyclase
VSACPACGEHNPARAKFCLECGAALQVVEARGEERKVVTVLFADLVGFTSRSEALDVEDVRGTLEPYHGVLRRELERHGGVVEKFIGDAVMALFGAPVAQEDDPERAVRAGLGIHEAIAELHNADPTLDLHVRIGIHTGEALVVLDADPAGGQGMAFGDVVNTAARLQSAAPVDGVLVGEATYRATRHVVAYREMPDVNAKGKQAPVRVWAVEEAGRPGARAPGAAGGVRAGRRRARAAPGHPGRRTGHRQEPAGLRAGRPHRGSRLAGHVARGTLAALRRAGGLLVAGGGRPDFRGSAAGTSSIPPSAPPTRPLPAGPGRHSAVELALAALLAGGSSAAEFALANQGVATPWSACALDLLRGNRSGALETVRRMGSAPYEAAILDYLGQCPDVPAAKRAAYHTRRDELLRDLAPRRPLAK